MLYDYKPPMIERIVSALSYITWGTVGFIWMILGLFTKASLSSFVRYHIFQSIFISIGLMLLGMLLGFLADILSIIPIINKIMVALITLMNIPAIGPFSLLQACLYSLVIYLAVSSFMGKYSYVPWVSDVINQNIGR